MAREIPEAVRAAAGLAATVIDEARKLPETLPGLPVRVIGLAMQLSMKLQQEYAGLVARGDELLTGIRGEDEPGLATFDDDDDPAAAAVKVGTSAFDRVAETIIEVTEADETEETDPAADVLEEVAIADLLDDLPAPDTDAPAEAAADADGLPEPEVLSDSLAPDETATVPTETLDTAEDVADEVAGGGADGAGEAAEVDVLTPDGGIATVEGAVTDEGVAAPEAAAGTDEGAAAPEAAAGTDATPAPSAVAIDEGGTPVAAVTDEPEGGSDVSGSQAVGAAPVDGYDSFSIAQLRGRLRGYAFATVSDLVAYEEATRAREPYLRMLRNRLEKLEEQAVESSPLAPRGA
jgi:hypothetical protein